MYSRLYCPSGQVPRLNRGRLGYQRFQSLPVRLHLQESRPEHLSGVQTHLFESPPQALPRRLDRRLVGESPGAP